MIYVALYFYKTKGTQISHNSSRNQNIKMIWLKLQKLDAFFPIMQLSGIALVATTCQVTAHIFQTNWMRKFVAFIRKTRHQIISIKELLTKLFLQLSIKCHGLHQQVDFAHHKIIKWWPLIKLHSLMFPQFIFLLYWSPAENDDGATMVVSVSCPRGIWPAGKGNQTTDSVVEQLVYQLTHSVFLGNSFLSELRV